jgi:hypothetical protein
MQFIPGSNRHQSYFSTLEENDEDLFVSQHSSKALILYRKAFRAGQ